MMRKYLPQGRGDASSFQTVEREIAVENGQGNGWYLQVVGTWKQWFEVRAIERLRGKVSIGDETPTRKIVGVITHCLDPTGEDRGCRAF